MSRIQEILNKAEREGTVRRTRMVSDHGGVSPAGAPAMAPMPAPPPVTNFDAPPLVTSFEAPPPAPWTPPIDTPVARQMSAAVAPRLDARLVAATAPQSLAAEQYRLLRTRVKRADNGRAVRTIIITSPSKGDGKSLTAANLSLTMAHESHQRVLLIDADFRRPSVARLFGVPQSPGLSDVLLGAADLESVLVGVNDHGLTLLPAGTPPTHPAELLGGAGMRRVLDTLRTRFDRILIDMPPVAPVADVHVVAPMTDGLLMIVRAGMTAKPAIERALAGLDASKVLGLVLNDATTTPGDRTAYEGYEYTAG